jgi:hypothetical protein
MERGIFGDTGIKNIKVTSYTGSRSVLAFPSMSRNFFKLLNSNSRNIPCINIGNAAIWQLGPIFHKLIFAQIIYTLYSDFLFETLTSV